ncbi:MAG TPA: cytochrome P450 [Pseudonocardiaceae bacterium]
MLENVPPALEKRLTRVNTDADQIDCFVPHQANGVMLDELVGHCGLGGAHTHRVLQRYGNLGSASVPVALDDAVRTGVSSTTTAEEVDRTKAELISLLADLVALKRREPSDDLTTALIEARDEQDRLSESELVGTLTIMIVAGHETTLDLLTNAVCALLTHPDQLALVQRGGCGWDAVIEETLRWDSPLGHLPMRYATEDIDIEGTVIRKGQAILASYVTVGRCPEYFGDTAEQFDVTRQAQRHTMFGYGVHSCPGAHLARLEAEIALPALFARFPRLALAAPTDELTPIPSIVNNCSKTLPVTLT